MGSTHQLRLPVHRDLDANAAVRAVMANTGRAATRRRAVQDGARAWALATCADLLVSGGIVRTAASGATIRARVALDCSDDLPFPGPPGVEGRAVAEGTARLAGEMGANERVHRA